MILLVIILFHKVKAKPYPPYLTITLIMSLLYIVSYYTSDIISQDLYHLSNFFLIISFYFIFLHYESLTSIRPSIWRYSLIFGLAIMCLTLYLPIFLDLYSDLSTIETLINYITSIYGILIILYALRVAFTIYSLTKERATRLEIVSLFLILSSLVYYLLEITIKAIYLSSILMFVGLIVLLADYIIYSDYFFRLPFPIYQIMIINHRGLLVYNRHTSLGNIPQLDPTKELLLSGYIKAITSIIEKFLGTGTQLKRIDTGIYQIYFSKIREKMGVIAIIASGGTYFLKESILRFNTSLSNELIESFQSPETLKEPMREEIDKLLIQAFPYLRIK